MEVIIFSHAVTALAEDGSVTIALFETKSTERRCVAILECSVDTARGLAQALGSTLKRIE